MGMVKKKYDLTIEELLNTGHQSYIGNTTSARAFMAHIQATKAMILANEKLEDRIPLLSTSAMYQLAETSKLITFPCDGKVIDTVSENRGISVIIEDEETFKRIILEIPQYDNNQFGDWEYKFVPNIQQILRVGNYVSKGTLLAYPKSSYNPKYQIYTPGINLLAVQLSTERIIEDGIPISESCSKKLSLVDIKNFTFTISRGELPLNIYGDIKNPRWLPRSGDRVGEKGLLIGKRSITDLNMVKMSSSKGLMEIDPIYDEIIYTDPNTEIISVEVEKNVNVKDIRDLYSFTAFEEAEQVLQKKKKFLNMIRKQEAFKLSPRLHNLVLDTKIRDNTKRLRFNFDKENYIYRIYIKTRKILPFNKANKIADRNGGKSIVIDVTKDEKFYKTLDGQTIDIVTDDKTIFSRMYTNRGYEPYISSWCMRIRKEIKKVYNYTQEWDYIKAEEIIIDAFTVLRGDYIKKWKSLTPQSKVGVIKEIINVGFFVNHIPSFMGSLKKLTIRISQSKYPPLKEKIWIPDGKGGHKISKGEFYVAKTYFIPITPSPYKSGSAVADPMMVEDSPTKNESKYNYRFPIRVLSTSPVGEAEYRVISARGLMEYYNFTQVSSNNFEAAKLVYKTLLTVPKPTNIEHIELPKHLLPKQLTKVLTTLNNFGVNLKKGGW